MIDGEKRQAGPGILFTVIALLLLVLNFRLIVDDPKLAYDDLSLIIPLKDLSSLSQYTAKIKNGTTTEKGYRIFFPWLFLMIPILNWE